MGLITISSRNKIYESSRTRKGGGQRELYWFKFLYVIRGDFPIAQMVKNLPATHET